MNIAKGSRSDLVADVDRPACAGKDGRMPWIMVLEPGPKIGDRVHRISIAERNSRVRLLVNFSMLSKFVSIHCATMSPISGTTTTSN